MRTFWGYPRPDGRVGVRNHILALATVVCANEVVKAAERRLPELVAITHQHGCAQGGEDLQQTRRTLLHTATHPNVYGAIIVSLGCETMDSERLAEEVAATGKPCVLVGIQEEGGTRAALRRVLEVAEEWLHQAKAQKRVEVPLAELMVGLECGGSDACSGISANPAVGVAADLLVAQGATVVLSETTEMIGAEHLLAQRAISPEVRERLLFIVRRVEERARQMGIEPREANPGPGNIKGGITTLEEKSLGCILKGGTTPLMEVVEYAQRPTRKGLVVMDTPGHDIESVTGMVAGGCQVVLFTTGRGSPTGNPIAPVIKIATNSRTFERMQENMDINAGRIVDGTATLEEVGREIFEKTIAVANGELTAAEEWGAREFAITRIGYTF